MRFLVVNCGSSSLKFDVGDLDGTELRRVASGEIEEIGPHAVLDAIADGAATKVRVDAPDHARALRVALDWLETAGARTGVDAVGHRVVHGGDRFVDAVVIDDDVLRGIESMTELAPLHNAPALAAIRGARDALGTRVPMVAAFDTAFHASMPARASHYAIDPDLARRHHVRRYGFHGLAHRSMLDRLDARHALAPLDTAHARVVALQLGNGCSAAAVDHGRSIDTSMGLTPLEGLVMGTRSGDVDPSLAGYLARMENVDVDTADGWLNTRSGLLGLSGRSRDMRDVLDAAHDGDARATLAVEMFCYRARRYVGGYLAALGGAEAVVFGGGIGEHSPEVRARILDGMQWCGIEVDPRANDTAVGGREARISTDGSAIAAWVVHVDEATVVARDTLRVLTTA